MVILCPLASIEAEHGANPGLHTPMTLFDDIVEIF
jgi:hypothetical protein